MTRENTFYQKLPDVGLMIAKCFASLGPSVVSKEVNSSTLPKFGGSKTIFFS